MAFPKGEAAGPAALPARSFIGGRAPVNRRGPAARFERRRGHAMHPRMGQERVEQAVARIERAFARIEQAAGRRPSPEPARDHGALREAHEALRSRVEQALGHLDTLIAQSERG